MDARAERKLILGVVLLVGGSLAVLLSQRGQVSQPQNSPSAYRMLEVKVLETNPVGRSVTIRWTEPEGQIVRLLAPLDPLAAFKVNGKPATLADIKPSDAKAIVRVDWVGQGTRMTVTSIEEGTPATETAP